MSKKLDRTGEESINTKEQVMTIIAYRNACDIDIQFEDGNIALHKHYSHFVNGNIENPMDKKRRYNRLGEVRLNK